MGAISDTQRAFREQISKYVLGELRGYDGEIEEGIIIQVEENCGSIWITMKNGKTYSIQITECEPE